MTAYAGSRSFTIYRGDCLIDEGFRAEQPRSWR